MEELWEVHWKGTACISIVTDEEFRKINLTEVESFERIQW
jgi:hypothetical protein